MTWLYAESMWSGALVRVTTRMDRSCHNGPTLVRAFHWIWSRPAIGHATASWCELMGNQQQAQFSWFMLTDVVFMPEEMSWAAVSMILYIVY